MANLESIGISQANIKGISSFPTNMSKNMKNMPLLKCFILRNDDDFVDEYDCDKIEPAATTMLQTIIRDLFFKESTTKKAGFRAEIEWPFADNAWQQIKRWPKDLLEFVTIRKSLDEGDFSSDEDPRQPDIGDSSDDDIHPLEPKKKKKKHSDS